MAMSDPKYDALRLENQLCFPLYACSREVVKRYRPLLEPLGLTYTQYIVMLVLWEQEEISVRDLGAKLFLDSGTLTPLLKKMEKAGLLTRCRSHQDERVLQIRITPKGMDLREQAVSIPLQLSSCVSLTLDEARELHRLLYLLLNRT